MESIILTADELFYSRVEARYSDENRSGYQIAYRTPGISKAEADVIEERVQCFNGGDIDRRYQFFGLPSGRFAIIVSRSLSEIDRDITDRNGRSGAFVAHCYVISAQDFQKIDNNPFLILEEEPETVQIIDRETVFELTAQGMIAIKDKAQSAIQIHVRPNDYQPDTFMLDRWGEFEKFQQLFTLALNAENYIAGGSSIAFSGENPMAIRSLVAALIFAIPPSARIHCSFDTFVDGCMSRPGILWLLSGESTIRNAKITRVDVETGDIENIQDSIVGNETDPKYNPLIAWLEESLKESSIATVMTQLPEAHQVATAFATNQPISRGYTQAQNSVVSSFLRLNREYIQQQFRKVVGASIPDTKVVAALEVHLQETDNLGLVNIAVNQKVDDRELADHTYMWLQQARRSDVTWETILPLATKVDHSRLMLVSSLMMVSEGKLGRNGRAIIANYQGTEADFAEAVQIVTQTYQVDMVTLVNKYTASQIDQYLRKEITVLSNMMLDGQIELLRVVLKHLDKDAITNYEQLVDESVIEEISNSKNRFDSFVLIAALIGIIAVAIIFVAYILLNLGSQDTITPGITEVDPTPESIITPDGSVTESDVLGNDSTEVVTATIEGSVTGDNIVDSVGTVDNSDVTETNLTGDGTAGSEATGENTTSVEIEASDNSLLGNDAETNTTSGDNMSTVTPEATSTSETRPTLTPSASATSDVTN